MDAEQLINEFCVLTDSLLKYIDMDDIENAILIMPLRLHILEKLDCMKRQGIINSAQVLFFATLLQQEHSVIERLEQKKSIVAEKLKLISNTTKAMNAYNQQM
jgi:hypothetical protein